VLGCRCRACEDSNTRGYHERQQKARCPKSRRSFQPICAECRARLVWNGLVDAAPARRHLRKLSRKGVGRDAVAAACDVAVTVINEVRDGTKRQIRAKTARALLSVDRDALADGANVDSEATWKLLDELLALGWTKGALALQLGMKYAALQYKRSQVRASTVLRVRKLHAKLIKLAPPGVTEIRLDLALKAEELAARESPKQPPPMPLHAPDCPGCAGAGYTIDIKRDVRVRCVQ
jgi:hypothetical protein